MKIKTIYTLICAKDYSTVGGEIDEVINGNHVAFEAKKDAEECRNEILKKMKEQKIPDYNARRCVKIISLTLIPRIKNEKTTQKKTAPEAQTKRGRQTNQPRDRGKK